MNRENPYAIMLAQLKTILLCKKTIQLSFFRLIKSWSNSSYFYRQTKSFSLETWQSHNMVQEGYSEDYLD